MSFENEINTLFQAGLKLFNDKNFYDAHEKWEDLWSDYYLKDRLFIQGLIQLSVSFVHLKNNNMNGAKSLLNKCKQKFEGFDIQRGIDVKKLLISIQKVQDNYDHINSSDDFNWNLVPSLGENIE
ncbi:hypothetical protein CM15mP37_01250 [bacterium]|nr:MAG: hypothetical protein CM15mP37_01250 [bacterium]|tara:strand:+ start:443 stop:817 length:375 start_codon:yes stop_codon:yes gene_type:complete